MRCEISSNRSRNFFQGYYRSSQAENFQPGANTAVEFFAARPQTPPNT